MPVMTDRQSVAANSTVANVLTGKLYEFLDGDSLVDVAVVAAATGVLGTVIIGTRTILNGEAVSEANRFPVVPDDNILMAEPGLGGERLTVGVENTTGAAIIVFTRVEITPIP